MDIGYRLKRIDDLMHKDANNMLDEHGVTFSQHHVLKYLDCAKDNTVPLKELERFFHVSQASMAGIVKRLEEKNYVTCFYKEDDKRIKYVMLSSEGKKISELSKKYIKKKEEKIISIYTKEELEQFYEYLDRLYKFLGGENNG